MENTKNDLMEQGYKVYENDDIRVYWNADLCEHSGNCVNGNCEVFNPDRRPWIVLGNGEQTNIAEVIDTCPSNALKYELKK